MEKFVQEFAEALNGGRGALDAWLECNNEADCRAAINGYVQAREAELLAWLKELYEAMIRYEGDVGGDAPQEHHEMMRSVAKIITKGECRRNPQHKGADMNIKLNEGEIYAGHYGTTPDETIHIILLPGDNDAATWQHQKEWAASIGGDLPNRIEQSLLWNNCRKHFKKDWYWSGEEHASDAGWAWYQYFYDGGQHVDYQSLKNRARAVRRLILE